MKFENRKSRVLKSRMDEIKIGIGTSEKQALRNQKIKLIRGFDFPDRVYRQICLSKWHWDAFDWLKTEKGWTDIDLVQNAWQLSLEKRNPEARNFEEEITDSVRLMISQGVRVYFEEGQTISNDN